MSNHAGRPRPRRDPRATLADVLGALDGGHVPGGCDRCDAVQSPCVVGRGVWRLDIFHDDACPLLAEMEARR